MSDKNNEYDIYILTRICRGELENTIFTSVHKTFNSVVEEVVSNINDDANSTHFAELLKKFGVCEYKGTKWQIDGFNVSHWYESNYRGLCRKVNEYVKHCRKLFDFIHYHIVDLDEEQKKEYNLLCDNELISRCEIDEVEVEDTKL